MFSSPVLASVLTNPMTVLLVSMAVIIVMIGVCRIHAFFSLIVAAAVVAVWTAAGKEWSMALDSVMGQLGAMAGGVAFPIAVAAVIGAALLESGAADKIVRRFLAVLGEKRAPWALLGAGYVLAVPVFFDTVFFLLIPLVRALSVRTGKHYLVHLMAVCTGGVITHATVPPTPGPLAVAFNLQIDLGPAMLFGFLAGFVPAVGGLWFARWCDRRMDVPLRATGGSSLESVAAAAHRDERELPGFLISIAPVVVPVVLIALASVVKSLGGDEMVAWRQTVLVLGNKNLALFLGAAIAVLVYLRQRRINWRQTEAVVGEPLLTAGVIILITAAGGAYGAMLKQAGVGEVAREWAEALGLNLVAFAWGLSALLRVAQGSTTVAVTTASGLVMAMSGAGGFPVHPLYLYLAIGYGGLFCSWMNDSGFWLFSRMGGLTERETLRTWTVLLSVISLLGLVQVLIVAAIFPGVP